MTVQLLLRKAQKLEKSGDFVSALKVYGKVLKDFPGNRNAQQSINRISNPPEVIIKQIISLLNRGEFKETIFESKQLLKKFPSSYLVYYFKGIATASMGEYSEAEKAFHKAVDLNPNFSDPYNNLGILLFENDELDRCEIYFQKAIKLSPKNHEYYFEYILKF